MRVLVRCKGGKAYGMGHLFRSLTLAQHLVQTGNYEVVVWGAEGDREVEGLVKAQDIESIYFADKDSSAQEIAWLKSRAFDVIVCDRIDYPDAFVNLARQFCNFLVVFNDMGLSVPLADAVICPQPLRKTPRAEPNQKVLYGTEYFILSDTIRQIKKQAQESVSVDTGLCLAVIMGGHTPRKVFDRIVEVLQAVSDCIREIQFYVGYGFDLSDISIERLKQHRISIFPGSQDIAYDLAKADLALASSGYVKFELAALGVPSILVSIVDHQDELGEQFSKSGNSAIFVGNLFEVHPEVVAKKVDEIALDSGLRQTMSNAGIAFLDGCALERIEHTIRTLG